jgi:hypothetical protein
MSTTVGETFPLGPGTLTIGATGTEIDVSCLVNNATVSASKNQGDSTTKLCGTVRPGTTTYDYSLAGNVDTDIADEAGLFALSQSAPGTEQEFSYTPNEDAGTTVTGTCVIDPLDFGGDTMGDTMTSDFEFSIVGAPTYAYGVAPGGGAQAVSTSKASSEPAA